MTEPNGSALMKRRSLSKNLIKHWPGRTSSMYVLLQGEGLPEERMMQHLNASLVDFVHAVGSAVKFLESEGLHESDAWEGYFMHRLAFSVIHPAGSVLFGTDWQAIEVEL